MIDIPFLFPVTERLPEDPKRLKIVLDAKVVYNGSVGTIWGYDNAGNVDVMFEGSIKPLRVKRSQLEHPDSL